MRKLPYILLIALFSCVSTKKATDYHSKQGRLKSVTWNSGVATLVLSPVFKKDTCDMVFRYTEPRIGKRKFRVGSLYILTFDSSRIKKGDSIVIATLKINY